MVYAASSPSPRQDPPDNITHLFGAQKSPDTMVGEEHQPAYDGIPSALARATRQHVTMISDDVVEEVAAACGMAASGLYMMLERRVGCDGSWTCTIGDLARAFNQNDRHVRAAIASLEEAGFLVRETIYGRGGVPSGVRFVLPKHLRTYDPEPTPEVHPEPTPEPRAPVLGVVDTSNEKEDIPSSKSRKRTTPNYPVEFLRFWEAYPPGSGSKLKAFEEWQRLEPDNELQDTIIRAVGAWQQSERWQKGFVKDAERFLSQRFWESIPKPVDQSSGSGRWSSL